MALLSSSARVLYNRRLWRELILAYKQEWISVVCIFLYYPAARREKWVTSRTHLTRVFIPLFHCYVMITLYDSLLDRIDYMYMSLDYNPTPSLLHHMCLITGR